MSASVGRFAEPAGRRDPRAGQPGTDGPLQAVRLVLLAALLPAAAVAAGTLAHGTLGPFAPAAALAGPIGLATVWLLLRAPASPLVLTSRAERVGERVLVLVVAAALVLAGHTGIAVVLAAGYLAVTAALRPRRAAGAVRRG